MAESEKTQTPADGNRDSSVVLANLAGGAVVDMPLMLDAKQVRTTKSGAPYLTVTLSDSTGEIRGVLFDYDSTRDTTEVGMPVSALGKVEVFRGVPRIRLRRIAPASGFDPSLFARRAARPIAVMSEEFGQLVRSIENRHVREAVKRTFRTDGLYRTFKIAPLEGAGYGAWVGGALEHTIRIARLIVSACETQPEIDRDLVLAAALLHQVGAVDATTGAPRIQQTARGRLMPRGVLSVMHLQAGFGAPESRSSFHHRLEELVLHSTPKSGLAVSGGESAPSSLEYAVLSGAIEMAYAVGARAEISRSHMAPVVPLRRVG